MRISTLFFVFFFIASNLYSQKTIKNGVIEFAVATAKQKSDLSIQPDSAFIPTQLTYTHYFSGNTFMLENMTQDSIIRIRHHRSKNGQGSYFFNLEDQDYKIDDLSEQPYQGTRTVDRLDTKLIAGYNCYKEKYYISETNFIELYVTKSIKPGYSYYTQIFPLLKGFPLEIVIHRDFEIYKYTAKSINVLPTKYPLLPDLQQYELLKEGRLKEQLMALIRA